MPRKKAAYLRYQQQRMPRASATTGAFVEKVLWNPQLLKKILLHLCRQDTVRGIPLGEPVAQLYVLKRVNRGFRTTIEGSIALARLMWLHAPEATTYEELEYSDDLQDMYFGPLEWLFDIIGISIMNRMDRSLEFSPYYLYLEGPCNTGKGLRLCRTSGFKHERASWRHMAAFQAVIDKGPSIGCRVSQPVRLGFTEEGDVEDHLVDLQEEELDVAVDDTLGAVFDQFVKRTRKTNEKKAEAIRSIVREKLGIEL